MRMCFNETSMRGWLLVAALAMSGTTAAAQGAPGAVEFRVKPDGVQPFTSSDASIRPRWYLAGELRCDRSPTP